MLETFTQFYCPPLSHKNHLSLLVGLKLTELVGQRVSLTEVSRSGVLSVLTDGATPHLSILIRPPCLSLPLLDHLQVEVVLVVQQNIPAWRLSRWLDGCVDVGVLL